LETFAREVLGSLRYRKQSRWAQVYLRGLLLEGRRKPCQPIAEKLPDGDEQCLEAVPESEPLGLGAGAGGGGAGEGRLLIKWPQEAKAPTKYWLSDLPERTSLRALVRWAKSRWAVEMNYREMKDHLGLDHFEGRGWVGWHRHVTMVMLAFAFVLSERLRRRKGGQSSPFPRSWAGCSACSPPGPVSASLAANPSPVGRGMT